LPCCAHHESAASTAIGFGWVRIGEPHLLMKSGPKWSLHSKRQERPPTSMVYVGASVNEQTLSAVIPTPSETTAI
jgi:hypothetical protein